MRDKILWLLLILLISSGVYVFFAFFESYEEEVSLGLSKEARKNPFLAAEFFLLDMDIQVQSEKQSLEFDEIELESTVFLSQVDSMLLTSSQIQEAVSWLYQGGHLIVGVGKEIVGRDSLLLDFDIVAKAIEHEHADDVGGLFDNDLTKTEETNEGDEPKKLSERLRANNEELETDTDELDKGELNEDEDTEDSECSIPEENYTSIQLSNKSDEILIKDTGWITLLHPDIAGHEPEADVEQGDSVQVNSEQIVSEQAASEDYQQNEQDELIEKTRDYKLINFAYDKLGVRFLQFEYGAGKLTVLSDSDLWRFTDIGNDDNAYLLAVLAESRPLFHIFYNVNARSLFALLGSNFFETIIALSLLLLLWLWRSFIRTGAIRQISNDKRRLFAEHLIATSEFYATHKKYTEVLAPMQYEINTLMQAVHPSFSRLADEEKKKLIATRCGLSVTKTEQWFWFLQNTRNNEEFIQAVQLGNYIRNQI